MNNPFTLTFGREPINRIDRLEQKDYVVNSFESNPPSNQVCMVTGVRGSGKTVFLTEIGKYFGVDTSSIKAINSGRNHYSSDLSYPIRNFRGSMNSQSVETILAKRSTPDIDTLVEM